MLRFGRTQDGVHDDARARRMRPDAFDRAQHAAIGPFHPAHDIMHGFGTVEAEADLRDARVGQLVCPVLIHQVAVGHDVGVEDAALFRVAEQRDGVGYGKRFAAADGQIHQLERAKLADACAGVLLAHGLRRAHTPDVAEMTLEIARACDVEAARERRGPPEEQVAHVPARHTVREGQERHARDQDSEHEAPSNASPAPARCAGARRNKSSTTGNTSSGEIVFRQTLFVQRVSFE